MVELLSPSDSQFSLPAAQLLNKGEAVVIVDDSPEIVLLLNHYLCKQGFTVFHAGSANELHTLLNTERIALVLLDIGLPDKDGTEILKEIVPNHPNLGIIMVTGTTDIQTALDCLREGADDYLTKPVSVEQFNRTIKSTLKKRRLAIDNRRFQKELEATNYQTQFLHQLNLKMNTAYLSTVELRGILQAILVGITSEEGLKFNRAFLALYNEEADFLEGRLAIGPSCREDAGRVWNAIKDNGLHLDDIITNVQDNTIERDIEVNKIVRELRIPTTAQEHILITAGRTRNSIIVTGGRAEGMEVHSELLRILNHDSFVVVPLYSPSKSLGVIIVDNFVTGKPITPDDVHTLEIFANQASLAIEHSHLYEDMLSKIKELELVTQELDRSKDLLVASERYSAIGHMSAQLVHVIRNPITSIGGTARLLARKTDDEYVINFLNIITKEAAKVESTLEDLFTFVEDSELCLEHQHLYPLVRRSVMIFYGTMKNNGITYDLDLPGEGPMLNIDGTKMRQVFLHLVKNAIEAMPDGGTLQVQARENESSVSVIIIDSGAGIAEGNLQRVSDPFFTTKTHGTGMGLTLVEQITSMHKATFTLTHCEGGGMTATVTIPK